MVERLREAIEKARLARTSDTPAPAARAAAMDTPAIWSALREISLDAAHLERARVITHSKQNPAHMAFDLLRTRLLRTCRERGWRKIAITSPTKGCGKSVVCANLALSIARQQELYAVLLDLDLRAPNQRQIFGVRESGGPIADMLSGATPLETALTRVHGNLAIGFNTRVERHPAEIMQSAATTATLGAIQKRLKPDLIIYDLPPLLVGDDAVGFLNNADAVLLVAGAGVTRSRQIEDCVQLMGDVQPLLGVVLNKQVDAVEVLEYATYAE